MQSQQYKEVRIRVKGERGLRHDLKKGLENALRAMGLPQPATVRVQGTYVYTYAPLSVVEKVVGHYGNKKYQRLIRIEPAVDF